MQCIVFWGSPFEAMNAFNKWAKGKALSKDVIIHTIYTPYKKDNRIEYGMCIIVYHPETSLWQEVQQ